MALDDLKKVIEKLQGMIKAYRDDYLSGKRERRTRQVLIDPLLNRRKQIHRGNCF